MRALRTGALTIAIASSALAGCGAKERAKQAASSLDPVAEAAEVTAQQKGGLGIALTGTIESGGQRIAMTATGTTDRSGKHGAMAITLKAGDQETQLDEVLDGHVLYMRGDMFRDKLPGGKAWMRLDLDAAAAKEGIDFAALGADNVSQDPAQTLDFLRGAGQSSRVGVATVRGAKTTHYHVEVDPQRAIDEAETPKAKASLRKVFSTLRGKTMPVDVYVDADKLVRRERFVISAAEKGESTTMDLTIDFTGFDVPVKATPPAKSDTVDALELLGSGAAGG